jgi:hypothetical protein
LILNVVPVKNERYYTRIEGVGLRLSSGVLFGRMYAEQLWLQVVTQGTGGRRLGLNDLGDWRYPIFVGIHEAMIGIKVQRGGLGRDRTMTSTVRAGSVAAHVLRNDVLQQHIDVRTRVEYTLFLILNWCRLDSEG